MKCSIHRVNDVLFCVSEMFLKIIYHDYRMFPLALWGRRWSSPFMTMTMLLRSWRDWRRGHRERYCYLSSPVRAVFVWAEQIIDLCVFLFLVQVTVNLLTMIVVIFCVCAKPPLSVSGGSGCRWTRRRGGRTHGALRQQAHLQSSPADPRPTWHLLQLSFLEGSCICNVPLATLLKQNVLCKHQ